MIISYQYILDSIELSKDIISELEQQVQIYREMMYANAPRELTAICTDGQPKGKYVPLGLNVIVEKIAELETRIEIEKQILEHNRKLKEKVDSKLKELKELDNKVVYMRDVEKKTLAEIADELGYSLDWIKKVSARNERVI